MHKRPKLERLSIFDVLLLLLCPRLLKTFLSTARERRKGKQQEMAIKYFFGYLCVVAAKEASLGLRLPGREERGE
jgi:hypothetical protein